MESTPIGIQDIESVHYANLTDIARRIQDQLISPVELTRHMLERIARVDGVLKSYATVTSERALAAAKKAEEEIGAGRYRGPLHGVPIAVKDLCYTAGTRTMGGLAVLQDFVPREDATVVSRLEAAGAVLLGKLALTEGAMAGYHRQFAIPVNPWNESYHIETLPVAVDGGRVERHRLKPLHLAGGISPSRPDAS